MRCAIVDPAGYDWESDRPLERPFHESIIYEVHVGGFTRSPSSGVRHPGTSAGMIEKILRREPSRARSLDLAAMPTCTS